MTITYKKVNDPLTGNNNAVNKIENGATETVYIPFDPANSDAQEFKLWLQEGNIPISADGETIITQEEVDVIIALLNG